MLNNIKILSSAKASQWCKASNMFAHSKFPFKKALSQFNNLSELSRKEIACEFKRYDSIRRKRIPKSPRIEKDDAFLTCVMVDANIIATEYNIDPLTAIMCINPPCGCDEKVIIK